MSAREEWTQHLARDEIDALLRVSNLRGAWTIVVNWSLIGLAFAAVAAWPDPLTMVASIFVIGGRQLAHAVVMHEAAHRTLFRDPGLNDWAGNWLAAYPIWAKTELYRPVHLKHHAYTGSSQDPDLHLVLPFPTSRASLRRKVWRDLSGQTGIKQLRATWRRYRELGWREIAPVAGTNAVLLGVLALAGHAELYLLWVVAWLTTYRLATRLRSIAEHAMAPDREHPLRNTRTTHASWWERLLVAPNRVNYHLEHHLLMTVPHYNLPRLHELLRSRGALDGALLAAGYRQILAEASSRV